MPGLNHVALLGWVPDAEVRTEQNNSGRRSVRFWLMTKDVAVDANGVCDTRNNYHCIRAWFPLGELIVPIRKGECIFVEGSLRTLCWEGFSGENCYQSEIEAHKLIRVEL